MIYCLCIFASFHVIIFLIIWPITADFWHRNSPSTTKTKQALVGRFYLLLYTQESTPKPYTSLSHRADKFLYFPHNRALLFQLNSVSARAPFSFDDIAPLSHLGFQFAVAAEQVTRGAQHYLQVYSEMFFDVSQPPLCPLITVVSRQISRHPSQRLYGGSLWQLLWGNGISCFTIQETWSGTIYHINSE